VTELLIGLREHLVAARLAGDVDTTPRSTITNAGRLVAGDDDYTFGLSDWRDASLLEAVRAVRAVFGGDPGGADDQDGPGWIDPDRTLRAIERHRERLAAAAASQCRVLLATAHPTGLLPHYAAIARALQHAGCPLLTPLDDAVLVVDAHGDPRGVRFLDGVACPFDGGSLRHTHRSGFMEAMLDDLGGGPDIVDLVVADHGMAGAAIERGIATLSIADVNDPALALAQARGRTDGVLPIDDNLAPRLFVPVTQAMLTWH
jgi:hypothetical protein